MGINYDADDEGHLMPPPSSKFLEERKKKKLETPLAAMLPSKYADIDVTQLFPDFRYGQVRNSNYAVMTDINYLDYS